MHNRHFKKAISIVFVMLILLSISALAYAHQGGTDANGGHYDHSTGEYHYHHGYGPHQHTNGVCPYDYKDNTDHKTGSSGSSTNRTYTPLPEFSPVYSTPYIATEKTYVSSYDTSDESSNSFPFGWVLFAGAVFLLLRKRNKSTNNSSPAVQTNIQYNQNNYQKTVKNYNQQVNYNNNASAKNQPNRPSRPPQAVYGKTINGYSFGDKPAYNCCPKCGGKLLLRFTTNGRFYNCDGENCNFHSDYF